MFNTTQDDPFITEMDPVQKLWMYNNWQEDQNEKIELTKNAILMLASFDHPDTVKKMVDESDKISSTEEEFEESLDIVKNFKIVTSKEKRKRKIIR